MSTHEAHLLMISKNKAYFGMMGDFDGEVSELPYLARETFINGTIPSLKGNCDSTHRGSPMDSRKCFVWNLWTQETHFAPSSTPITHFATILESFEDLENFKILLHFTILGISVDVDMA